MRQRLPDYHQLAVAILAIATAAIGFGLFGGALSVGEFISANGFNLVRSFQVAKLVGAVASVTFYFLVVVDVAAIFQKDEVSGQRIRNGPMFWFFLEMVSLGGLFLVNVLEELSGSTPET